MADVPSFEDFKKQNPDIPSFDEFQKGTTSAEKPMGFGEALKDFVLSPHGLIRTGLGTMGAGARHLFTPGQRMQGANELFEGGTTALAPAAIGAALPALASAPVSGLLGMGGGALLGTGAQKGGEAIASGLGASPEASRMVGNVTGTVAGPLLSRVAGAGLKRLAEPFVKSALGIPGRSEAYGATPAKAVLEETPARAIRPATVEEESRLALDRLR